MKFLVINTAAPVIEIATVIGEKVNVRTLQKVMAAEQLLPNIDEMLNEQNLSISDFDQFVCTVGPGSFTGIRIGINTVRTLAYALNKNAYGVTYCKIMSYNSIGGGKTAVVIDGGANVCYVAAYDGEVEILQPTCIYKKDVEAFLASYDGFERIADYDLPNAKRYVFGSDAIIKAAKHAIKNESEPEPLYIRKPQPDRKESDI